MELQEWIDRKREQAEAAHKAAKASGATLDEMREGGKVIAYLDVQVELASRAMNRAHDDDTAGTPDHNRAA